MWFSKKSKTNNPKNTDNQKSKELNALKKALSANRKKPEVKLTKNLNLTFDMYTARFDMNVFLFGGSDDDKIARHINPNISAFDRNYVIIDCNGVLYNKYGREFENRNYSVNYVNLCESEKSYYNPMGYVCDEKSAYHLAMGIMDNIETDIAGDSKGMWETAELNVLFATIWALSEKTDRVSMKDVACALEEGLPGLDSLFSDANTKAAGEYVKFKQDISPETQKGVILSLASKLQPFKTWAGGMTSAECVLDSKEFVFGKKALFINIPQGGKSKISAAVFLRQLITSITGEMAKNGIFTPQYPLHFILNNADKVGKINLFGEIMGASKSQTFGFSMFYPSISSMLNIYGDDAKSIFDNCDAYVCLSDVDSNTAEWLNTALAEKDEQSSTTIEEIKESLSEINENRIFVKIRGYDYVLDEVI